MWIDENTDFSPNSDGTYPYNGKTFTVTVNVYANAKIVTDEEIALESNADLKTITLENTELFEADNPNYDYETVVASETKTVDLNTETYNPNAQVSVEKISSPSNVSLTKPYSVRKLSTSKSLELTNGENYFKIKVTTESNITKSYILKINVGKTESVFENTDEVLASFNSSDFNDSVSCSYIDLDKRMYFDCNINNTLSESIDSKNKGLIIVTNDLTFDTMVEIPEGKTLLLDVNGKKIDFTSDYLQNKGNLYLTSSKNGGTMSGVSTAVRTEIGTTEVENIHLYTTVDTNDGSATIAVLNNSILNVKGNQATYDSNGNYVSGTLIEGSGNSCINTNSTLNVYNGSFKYTGAIAAIRSNSAVENININVYNAYIEGEAFELGANCPKDSIINIYGGIFISTNYSTIYNKSVGTINIVQTSTPIYISSVSQVWMPSIRNNSTGKVQITANQADKCTSNYNDTTSGLCVYAEGNRVYTTNTGSCAVSNDNVGTISINGGTYFGGNRGINNNGTETINILNAKITSGRNAVLNNSTGTYQDICNNNVSGRINYSSNVKFNSGNNTPITSGSGSSNIKGGYTGTCIAN